MTLTPEEELARKLEEARARQESREAGASSMHSLGDADSMIAQGIRMILEFAAPIGIAGFLGYHIDKWLDSAPFVMLFMCLLGFAAGIMNVYRSAMGYTGGVGFKKTSEEEEDEEDNG